MKEKDIEIIKEGLVEIHVPKFEKVSASAPVFYNSRMELNRDISILALQTFQEEVKGEINICDVFGGSGIRAIRYKKEINGVGEVFANDISSLAVEQSKNNAIANNVDIEIHQKEANIFLRENRGIFDVIDIDPFGTPSYFLDSASYAIKKDSLLCVTATDTSALCGTYKEPCIRKYNAKPYRSEYYHENGIRILAGFVALTLAKYKKYIEDIKLSHSSEHYMRLYIRVNKGSKATDDSLANNIGHIVHCKKCLHREATIGLTTSIPEFCPICGEKMIVAGPLWIGKLQNHDFISKMISKLESEDNDNDINNDINNDKSNNKITINTEKKVLKLLYSCLEEADAPITFYDIHVICKNLKISAPKLADIMEKMNEKGFTAFKTHFNPIGLKSDIPIERLKEIIKSLVS
jgi:tRNA (guanine26-N2/guanine27-N2)-dimethyltransferase